MKTAIVSIENQKLTVNGQSCNFMEAGLYNCQDNEDIIECLNEKGYDVKIEKFDKLEKILSYAETNKGFLRGCGDEAFFNYSIGELEELGWYFDHEGVEKAMKLSPEEAEKYTKENYCVIIAVNEIGQTQWHYKCNNFKSDNYNESSDNEETGDDNATVNDIFNLEGLNL